MRRDPAPMPNWAARPHRVLYLRYDHLGDLVLATGILRAIAEAQPSITLDVMASDRNFAALLGNPHIGSVYRVNKRRPWRFIPVLMRIRRVRYDAVIDPVSTAPSLTTMLLMWASGAQHRIGVAGRGNDGCLTLAVPKLANAVHLIDHSAALLAAFGVDVLSLARNGGAVAAKGAQSEFGWGLWQPQLFLTSSEMARGEALWQGAGHAGKPARPSLRLVVNVSAGRPWRYWPQTHFIEALRRIRASYPEAAMLVLGAPGDRARVDHIGAQAEIPVVRTSIREMFALIATADAVFTPDTSITHIASAFGKPVLAMFARGGGELYGPYGTPSRVVVTRSRSLSELATEPVLSALRTFIEGIRGSSAR